MTRKEILTEAEKCVCGKREEDYGAPEDNFRTIAGFWSTYLMARGTKVLCAQDVAAMMALMKIARTVSGRQHDDSWIDIAGYAACGGELSEVKERA